MCLQVYTVEVHEVYTRYNSSRSTNRQVCANHNGLMQKGVLNGMFVIHQLSLLNRHTSTDFEDIFTDHVT